MGPLPAGVAVVAAGVSVMGHADVVKESEIEPSPVPVELVA